MDQRHLLASVLCAALVNQLACTFDFDRRLSLPDRSISGQAVIDGEPAPFAQIELLGTLRTTRADGDGRFRMENLRAGTTILRAYQDENADGWPERESRRAVGITNTGLDLGQVELEGVVRASGQVTLNGAPVGGVFVAALSLLEQEGSLAETPAKRVSTDDTGAFIFPALASVQTELVAILEDDEGRLVSQRIRFTPEAGDNFEAELPLILERSDADISVDIVFSGELPTDDRASIVLTTPGGEPNFENFDQPLVGAVVTAAPGIYDLHVRTESGLRADELQRVVVASDDSVRWVVRLSDRPLCAGDDCDGDGQVALPQPGSTGDEVLEQCLDACAATPEQACEVAGIEFDCNDDGDGQSDVTESVQCARPFAGGDRDSDGICDASDLFDNCAENDPSAPACAAGNIPEPAGLSSSWTEPNLNDLDVDAGGEDQVAEPGDALTLSASVDERADRFTWTQLSGPSVQLQNADTLTPSFVVPQNNFSFALVFELRAFTQGGLSGSDVIVIQVTPNPNAPVIEVATEVNAPEGEVASVNAIISDDDPIVAIIWEQLAGSTILDLENADTATVSFLAPEVDFEEFEILRVTAIDQSGLQTQEVVRVRIVPDALENSPPRVEAGSFIETTAGDTVVLQGAVSDADGTIVRTLWTQLDGPDVTPNTPDELSTSFRVPTEIFVSETLRFQLEAEDNQGAIRRDQVVVLVDAAGATPLEVGAFWDFEGEDDVFTVDDFWQRGTPNSGPDVAYSGSSVWASNLEGRYDVGEVHALYLPPIDVAQAQSPTLSFRAHVHLRVRTEARVEYLNPNSGWETLNTFPETVIEFSAETFENSKLSEPWRLFTARLPLGVGDKVRVRFLLDAIGGNGAAAGDGLYIDDVRVNEESSDPDGDGIIGIQNELLLGTDPFVSDTDGDGFDDGEERELGSDPISPAEFPGSPTWTMGHQEDFSVDNGGLVSVGGVWEFGTVASGPNTAVNGDQAWATNLAGSFSANQRGFLYLPQVDLRTAIDPIFSVRVSSNVRQLDGASLEFQDQSGAWLPLSPFVLPYEETDADGFAVWGDIVERDPYQLALFSLAPLSGQHASLRFVFRSSGVGIASGVYLDEMAVTERNADSDLDGVFTTEELELGWDPFFADSDGDGTLDGAEQTANSDALNPADFPGAPRLSVGSTEDLLNNDGGLAALGRLWEFGSPSQGPDDAAGVWATDLDANYFNSAIEQDLYLPLLDLRGESRAQIRFQMFADCNEREGVGLEVQSEEGQWIRIAPLSGYTSTDFDGAPLIDDFAGPNGGYGELTFDLSEHVGRVLAMRFRFESSGSANADGIFIDSFSVVP